MVQDPAAPPPQADLNQWMRGSSPQEDFWYGRLALLGLVLGLTFLVLWRLL
ncbi:MAG: high light inducible protein [Aphanocapsa feldmannii 277cI]|uniref:High light inducible protein n=1 Tax=Aphanocapsa feldmannii 277cI TaxID=2507554 RepID=A0A524RUN0_9CHRO|nr:MAG: high light inducible protein [Aphanocapsa feldmannii 277cI]